MPGSLTNYGEELALNLLFRNAGEGPIEVFLGLATQPNTLPHWLFQRESFVPINSKT